MEFDFGGAGDDEFDFENHGDDFGFDSSGDDFFLNHSGSTETRTQKLNLGLLLISLILGLIMGIFGSILYNADINSILKVGLYFFVFTIVYGACIGLNSIAKGRSDAPVLTVIVALAGALAMFMAGTLFEFIYELSPSAAQEPVNGYVFLVDNSGSMDSNDPQMERYAALRQIVSEMESTAKTGMYLYSSDVENAVPYGEGILPQETLDSASRVTGGATAMISAIKRVAADTKDSGDRIVIINLTDGSPTDDGFFGGGTRGVIKTAKKQNMVISSVGFGNDNKSYLTRLADSTGGTYIHSGSTSDLYQSLKQAINTSPQSGRDIIGYRNDFTAGKVLYTIERILFIFLLGCIFAAVKCLTFGDSEQYPRIFITSAILSLLAAVFTELMCSMYVNIKIVQIIMCVFFAVLVTYREVIEYGELGHKSYFDDEFQDGMRENEIKDFTDNSQHKIGF